MIHQLAESKSDFRPENKKYEIAPKTRPIKNLRTVPTSYPWVNFLSYNTSSIMEDPTLIVGSTNTYIVDSIWICNTSTNDIFITIYKLVIDVGNFYFRNNHLVSSQSSQDVLNTSIVNNIPLYAPSTMILLSTELLHAYTNTPDSTFDCTVSYRQLLEESS